MLLFPDPRPLIERLGRNFFLRAPTLPGVYLMRGSSGVVLYVGKAKNLRKRLACYRVANPDRIPRRHLRLMRLVERVDFEECADETHALAREAELLRSLKPRFNRAGTWPGPPRFLCWRRQDSAIEFSVAATPGTGWSECGPLGASAFLVMGAMARLLWCACHPGLEIFHMPYGWLRTRFPTGVTVACGNTPEGTLAIERLLSAFFAASPDPLVNWIKLQTGGMLHSASRALLEADLETLTSFSARISQAQGREFHAAS
jgi:predicted GIY-YIG superfamily endonuclease